MQTVLNFLLSYLTLAAAGIVFVIIFFVLFAKRKALSKKGRCFFVVLLAILAVYFVFIFCVTIAAGANQPANTPTPIMP